MNIQAIANHIQGVLSQRYPQVWIQVRQFRDIEMTFTNRANNHIVYTLYIQLQSVLPCAIIGPVAGQFSIEHWVDANINIVNSLIESIGAKL